MKNTAKKIISLLLAMIMAFGAAPVSVFAADAETQQVQAKNNFTWSFDSDTGVLTVSGSGNMDNLINPSDYPWYRHKNEIKEIVIENGVTSVGASAFAGSSASSVTITDSVKYIGDEAFAGCANLAVINVADSFTGFGMNAFDATAHYSDNSNWKNGAYYIGSTLVKIETNGSEYTIPSGTVAVADFAVISSTVTNVNIPSFVKYIGSKAFANSTALKTITVDENNADYSSDASGALYNKDKTKLICAPSAAESMAKFYNVNYYVDGQLVHTESVEEYKAIPEYTYDPGEGITFSGWSEIPETMPEKDIDVYGTCTLNTYTITFTINNKEHLTVPYTFGSAVTAPEYTAPIGHSFSGWDIPETMPARNLTLNATLSVNTYNAVFYLDDAHTRIHATVPTVFGEKIKFPSDPQKDGYAFLGWDNDSTVMDTEGKSYVAIWGEKEYSVKFYSDNDYFEILAYADQIIYEEDVPEPTFPGYIFRGWVDEDGEQVSFPITVTGDMNFQAMFVAGESPYSVEIYVMNTEGEYDLSSEMYYSATTDSYVTYEPEDREGFTVDASLSKLGDYITSDGIINLYVYYSRNKYTVTIDGVENQYYYYDTITLPDYSREGFVFNGWMDENGNAYPPNSTLTVTQNVSLTPIFTLEKYTVSFMVNGSIYATLDCDYGSVLEAPEPPQLEGYTFYGWSMTEGGEIVSFPITVPSGGAEFYAVFTANSNVMYTIQEYYMNTEGTGWGESATVTSYGTTGETVSIVPDEKEGFTVDTRNSTLSAKISGDGSTVLTVYYIRNQYTVTYMVDGVVAATEKYYYKSELAEPYGGSAYLWKYADGTEVPFPLIISDNITIYGEMPVSSEPSWEIKEGVTVTEFSTMTVLGGFESALTEQQISDCFECNEFAYITVSANASGKYSTGAFAEVYGTESGELIATYYIAVSGDLDGDGAMTADDGYIIDSEIYSYTNWSKETVYKNGQYVDNPNYDPVKIVAADKNSSGTINMQDFTAFGFVWYRIETYTMNMSGGYDAGEPESFIGIAGQNVTAETNPYEGYAVNTAASMLEAILAVGTSTVLTVYYDLQKYTITFVVMDEKNVCEYYYGEAVEIPADPEVPNHTFAGWDTDIPATMPAVNLTVTAMFERISVMLIPAEGSTTVIDREGCTTSDYVEGESEWCIYGLREYLNEEVLLENYLDVQGDGFIEIIPVSEGCYGTGTVVNVRDYATMEIVESFRIVVFGDLNGDSVVQAVDYSMIIDTVIGLTDWGYGIYYMVKAADLGYDLSISAYDASLIEDVCLGLYAVDQVTGQTTDIFPETPDDYSAESIHASSGTAAIRTEIHALSDDGEWVKTDKVKAGEEVKARVFIDTGYFTNAGSLMFFYDSDFFTDSYTYSQPDELTTNTSGSAYDNGVDGRFAKLEKTNPTVKNLISYGYLTESFVNEHEIITSVYKFSPSTSKTFSGDEWIMEFDLTVKEDATDFGDFFVIEDTVKNADDGVYAYINLPVGAEDSEQSKTTSLHLCDVVFKAESCPVEISKTVEITFDAGFGTFADGTSTYTVEASVGEAMPEIPVPELEGHYFVGWSYNPSVIIGLPELCPDTDTVFYAIFETTLFTVKQLVYYEDGSFFKIAYEGNLEYGETVPLVPSTFEVPDGYALSPAYTSEDFNELYPEGTFMPAEDITIYYMLVALDYIAVFDANGGAWADGESEKSVTATYDSQIIAPENPVKEGYVFIGWSPDVSIMDKNGKTFIATWKAETYTATYRMDGEIYEEYSMEYGAETEYPADPYKEGYVFVGWTPLIPSTMPAEDLEFNAVFEVNQYEVIFRIDGMENTAIYNYGDTIYTPDPTKIGHRFVGWDNPIPATMPAEDLVFIAQFEPLPYDAVFDANGGEWYDGDNVKIVENVAFGSGIIAPNDHPVREGYLFAGWSEYGTDDGVGIMDKEGKTFYAVWNQDLCYCRIQNIFCATNGAYAPQNAIYVIKTLGNVSSIQFVNMEDENASVTFDKPEDESDCVSDDLSKIGVVSVEAYNHDDLQVVLGSDETAYEIWTVVAELDEGDYKVRANINGTEEGWESTDDAYDYRVIFDPKNVELILNANGGSFGDGSSNKFITALYGESIEGIYEEPSYDGYVFTGWLDENGNEVVFNGTMPDAEGMLCAQWAEIVSGTFENLEYSFNKTSGELVISGEGNMPTDCYGSPWHEFDIKSVIISEGITSIGNSAFSDYYNLTSVKIPNSVTSIGNYAFSYCYNLTDVYYAGIEEQWENITIGECNETLTSATIHYESDTVETASTFSLHSFFGLSRKAEADVVFKVPETVTEISDYAFMYSKATRVKIPASVAVISETAFAEAAALEYVEVNGDNEAFADKNGVLFTKNGDVIVAYPRAKDDSGYTLPIGTKAIGAYAFNGSTLEKIYLPSSLETIGDYAFCNSNLLTYADIENGVTRIGDFAFFGCPLESADMPEDMVSVGNYAFFGSRLSEIGISESVADIGEFAFAGNFCLEKITVDENNAAYESGSEGVLFTKNKAELIQYPAANAQTAYVIPDGVSYISDIAFFVCENLSEIIFPESLTVIGEYAFDGCSSVKSINVPEGVMRIGDGAFSGCSGVMRMKLGAEFVDYVDFREMTTLMDLQFTGDTSAITIPEQIINFTAVGSYDNIQLSWSKSTEARSSSYRIFRKGETDSDWSLITTINSRTTLTYTDSTAEEDIIYKYVIVTVDEATGIISPMSHEAVCSKAEDTVPPVVTKITPESLSFISGEKTFNIYATDDLMMSKVTLHYSTDDGVSWTPVGSDSSSPYSITLDTTVIPDGIIRVKVLAYDAAGNESAPMTASYTVDNSGPAKIKGLRLTESYATFLTLAWDDVAAGDAASFILQMKNSDGTYRTKAGSISDLGYTVTGLAPDTEYIFRVAARDEQGNIGEYSDDFTVSTASDTTAPDTKNLLPSPGRYNNAISFKATATDNFAVKTIEIQVSTDRINWETVDSAEYTDYSSSRTFSCVIPINGYDDGSIFVRALATDFAGNNNVDDGSFDMVEYIVDTTAPNAPQGVYAAGGDGWIYLRWDIGSEDDLSTYSVYRSTTKDGSYALIKNYLNTCDYYDTTAVRDVVYYYKIRVIDSLGNISDFSEPVAAKVADDITPPQIISISPASGSEITPLYKVMSVYSNDNASLASVKIEYKINDAAEFTQLDYFELESQHYITTKSELPVASMVDGDKITVHIVVTDISGLTAEKTVEYSYVVDTEAPVLSNLGVAVDGDYCKITWTDAADTDAAGYKIYCVNDDGTFESLGSRAKSSKHSYIFYDKVADLGTGDYAYKVDAYDAAGNINSYFTDSVHYEYVPDEGGDDSGESGGGSEGGEPDDPDVPVNAAPNVKITAYSTLEVGVEEYFDAGGSYDDSQIVSFLWDFGDGTTSSEVKAAKKYEAVGTYTVTLTVTDDGGLSTTGSFNVTVHEREALGTVKVTVLDSNGKVVPDAPVYFDVGGENEKAVLTDKNGVASLKIKSGTYNVCVRIDDYVPDTKVVTVLPNAERKITLNFIEQKIVEGEFEVKRLTHEEVKEAGIDPSDYDNQNFYKTTVTIQYGESKIPIHYIRNDNEIIGSTVGTDQKVIINNSNGNIEETPEDPKPDYPDWTDPVPPPPTPNQGGSVIINTESGHKQLTPILVPNDSGHEMIMMLEMPVGARCLKEIFEVSLHIFNNAYPAFTLLENEIMLNIPEGMSLVKNSVTPERVTIDTIEDSTTIRWLLQGDDEGNHLLTADFNGKLSMFNDSPVTATFSTYIRVYGMSDIKINLEVSDEIKYNAFYFNIGLVNDGTVDKLNLNLDYDGVVRNISASTLQRMEQAESGEDGEIDTSGDFEVPATLMNVRYVYADGTYSYIPYTVSNGHIITGIDTVAPGEAIYYEYVAYNAINYDGIAVFEDAAVEELGKYSSNVTVSPISMNLYDSLNVINRLTKYGSIDKKALNYLITDGNYFYWNQATGTAENSIGRALYNCSDAVVDFTWDTLNHREKSVLAEKVLLQLITSNDVVENIGELTEEKYIFVIQDILSELKAGFVSDDLEETAAAHQALAWIENAMYDYELLGKLGADLRMKGAEGLKGELISQICIAAESQLVKYDSFAFLTDDYIVNRFAERCNYSKEILDPAILESVKAVSQEYFNQYIYNAVQLSACVEEELFLTEMLGKYCDRSFLDSDYVGIVKVLSEKYSAVAESCCLTIVTDIRTNLESMEEEYEDEATEKEVVKNILSPITNRTNLIYTLLGTSYDARETVLSIGNDYKTEDIITLAECISTVFVNAWVDHNADFEYNGQTLEAAVDATHLLKYLSQSRLIGESLFKEFAENVENDFLRSLNNELHSGYESVEILYDEVYKNILEARDTIFNIEETQTAEKPAAPNVSVNYDTLATNEKFDETYEYCYSDGEWMPCDGEEIPIKLKSHTTVLRVRKASADSMPTGEITTVTIWGQRELRKNISVRYDDGVYYFTNLSSLYSYQICPIENQYDEPDWSNAVTVAGGYNASASADFGKYLAIRSCENADKKEIVSKTAILKVNTKQLLTVSVWGSGSVTQSSENGKYFIGEDAYLNAIPSNSVFEGWYVDGTRVSGDKNYILEMYEFAEITAKFTGDTEILPESASLSILTDNEIYSLTSGQTVPMIYAGAKGKLIANILPENADNKSVEWKSSNENIAVINSNGVISFLSQGKVTVTATLSNGITVSAEITVLRNGVEECYIASMPDKTTYFEDEELDLDGLVLMAKYTNGTVREVTDYEISGFDNTVGDKTVVLTHKGMPVELQVKVIHNSRWIVSKQATCTKTGVRNQYCLVCGLIVDTQEIPVTDHICKWVITTEATPDSKGIKEFICTVCGTSTKSESVDWCDHEFNAVTVSPECGKEGYTVYTCTKCGYEKTDDYTEALSHSYNVTVLEPTCTRNGCTVHICRLCSDKYITDRIEAKGHSYTEEQVEASCASEGYTLHSCSNCGDSYKTNLVKKLPHSYSAAVTEPTCSAAGYTTYTCSVCESSYIADEVDPIVHKYESEKIFADCAQGGYTLNTCTVCGNTSKTDIIEPAEHSYGEWIIKTPSSESASGLKYRVCTVCSKEETQVIPIVDHDHIAGDWVVETEAECDNYGVRARRCEKCGEIVESELIPAPGHKYSSAEIIPTCTTDGYTLHTCSECGNTYTDGIIPAEGHTEGEWITIAEPDCDNEGMHEKYCTVCEEFITEETVPALNHSSWQWKVVTESTCSTSGLRIKVCDYCGKEVAEEITAASGHQYTAKVTPKTCTEDGFTTYTCSVCSDTYEGGRIAATGHAEGDWIVSVEPTVETEGKREKRCTECGELLDSSVIPTLKEPVLGITISQTELELICEETAALTAMVTPSNALDKTVLWSSDNPDVAHVDENGQITAISAGTATVTASTAGGEFSASCKITVLSNMYEVAWIVDGEKITETVKVGSAIEQPANPEKKGYSFNGWTPEIPDAMPKFDIEFTAVWSANSYDAVFDANGGKWSDGKTTKTVTTAFDSQISAPEAPVKEGYSFGGWDKTVDIMDNVEGKIFRAVWLATNESRYTVETYLMNTEGVYEKTVQALGGIGGSIITLNPELEAGLALNAEKSVLSGMITADNALVLKVYIDREIYTFTTVIDGLITSADYYYGSFLPEIEDPVKDGFVFDGWDKAIPQTMPAGDLTVTAIFKTLNISVAIVNNPDSVTIKHGETLKLTASVSDLPEGAYLVWYVDGVEKARGETYSLYVSEGSVTVEVKAVSKDGKVITDNNGAEISDSQKVTVNSSIWQRIVSFFKNLFRMNRTVIQSICKGIF